MLQCSRKIFFALVLASSSAWAVPDGPGLYVGPIGNFARNQVPIRNWDNWQSSWGGGLAIQADLAYFTFEIDTLWMQRKYRYSATAGSIAAELLLRINQVEVPILAYIRADSLLGAFRFGGGVSNNFGVGTVSANAKAYINGTMVAEATSERSFSSLGIDPRGVDGIAAFGWDAGLAGKKLKFDFRYQFALADRSTSSTAFKPRSFNFLLGILL